MAKRTGTSLARKGFPNRISWDLTVEQAELLNQVFLAYCAKIGERITYVEFARIILDNNPIVQEYKANNPKWLDVDVTKPITRVAQRKALEA